MRSWPPSGEGLTSGVANADRCDIVTACCDPASFSSGLPLATPWSHAFVAAWRSFDEALVTPNSMPCVNTVCPLSSPYPFCGTTLIDVCEGRLVQLSGTAAWKILLLGTGWYCADGFGTGCPGVPTACSASPPPEPPPPLASSPIHFAAGRAAKTGLIV